MPQEESKVIVRFPSWEVIAVIVGFFSTANDVPIVVAKLLKMPTDGLKASFIQWSLIGYGIILFLLSANYLIKIILPRKQDKKESVDLEKFYNQIQYASYLKTFGFALLLDIIRNKANISLFDQFKRPTHWTPDLETFDRMYRLWMKRDVQTITLEVSMMKDFSGYKIREAIDENFGISEVISFFDLSSKYLAFTSGGMILFTIIHLMVMPFQKLKLHKRVANFIALVFYAITFWLIIR